MSEFLYGILKGINSLVGNYGVAIILFTILIRLICMPFDFHSRKGMRKMQALQPKINELQKKYQNDPAKMQQKQAELMKKEGASMFSGCLPMLLTWPLMLAMFAAMRSIAAEQTVTQALKFLAGEENVITTADRFLWVKNIWMTDSFFAPVAPTLESLRAIAGDVWEKAYSALTAAQQSGVMQSLGLAAEEGLTFIGETANATVAAVLDTLQTIPAYTAATAHVYGWQNISLLFFINFTVYQQYNGWLLLPILAGLAQVLQYKFNPQMKEQAQVQNPQAPGAGMGKFMQYFFPILSVFFCLSSNAGFAVYWVTSTLVMWGQSILITKILEKQDEKKAQSVAGEGSVK